MHADGLAPCISLEPGYGLCKTGRYLSSMGQGFSYLQFQYQDVLKTENPFYIFLRNMNIVFMAVGSCNKGPLDRADSWFASSQLETALLCNDV